jgi:hypothetical protein
VRYNETHGSVLRTQTVDFEVVSSLPRPSELLELDHLIAPLTHEFQHVTLACNTTTVKLTVGITECISLRTGCVGVLPGIEIQCVLRIHYIVYPARKRGTHHEVLEFLRYNRRLDDIAVREGDINIGGQRIKERLRTKG